jgi:hypothetical protein
MPIAKLAERDMQSALQNPESQEAAFFRERAAELLRDGQNALHAGEVSKLTDFQIFQQMYPKQNEILLDYGSTNKIFVAGRRGEKTSSIAAILLMAANHSQGQHRDCLYVAQTQTRAFQNIYNDLLIMNEKAKLEIKSVGLDRIEIGEDLTLFIGSYHSLAEASKFRGKAISIFVVDEVQDCRQVILQEYLEKVIGPAMATYYGVYDFYSTLTIIAGSAKMFGAGSYLRGLITSPNWKSYHSTLWDNLSMPDHDGFVKDYLIMNNMQFSEDVTKHGPARFHCDDPAYQMEIMGNLDYVDTDLQVFPTNIKYEKPPERFSKNLIVLGGIDPGFTNATGLALVLLDDDPASQVKTIRGKVYTRKKMWIIHAEGIYHLGDRELQAK